MPQLQTCASTDTGWAASGPSAGRRTRPGPGARIVAAARRAWPALLGYAVVRALGVALVLARTDKTLLDALASRWDTAWYLTIAEEGYPATCPRQGELCRYAFFPLYPTLIRGAAAVSPLSAQAAAWLIAMAASMAAAWGIFAVIDRVAGGRAASVTVVMWGIVPHAVVQSMAYTEALFTAVAAWALYAVLTHRWLTAGLLALLAGLTRPTGAALVAAVVLYALWTLCRRPAPRPALGGGAPRWLAEEDGRPVARLVGAVVVAPLGWCFWFGWVGHRAGRWDGYFRVQQRWGSAFDGGAYTMRQLNAVFTQATISLDKVVIAGTIAACVVLLLICVLQRQPAPLLVYAAATLLITLGGAGYFHSKARFLLPAFTLLLPLAKPLARARPAVAWTLLAGATVVSSAYGSFLLTVSGHSP
ncbi:glycosyltransferase family 39 protein [Streptomyces ficellus]|uniref:Glycosyltransferase family 39 protein n=1 Tax=Streptomyces ficellus TaxID=1977088 RepID=A0ABT7Z6I8_9ACTN|nr:glycosyltransferase family 39 protein [Streptomyces ficellus]MDN3294701.1 glycosyltransferase family 39 protein [Streptomyces ficellus]